MENESKVWPTTDHLKLLKDKAHTYSFFQLAQIAFSVVNVDEEKLSETITEGSFVRFKVSSSIGFPKSDVESLELFFNDIDESIDRIDLSVNFLGLHGTDSPLPGYYIEDVVSSYEEDAVKKYFLDFFNHRLLTLLYAIWRKYRYFIRFSEGANDFYSNRMLSLFGCGDSNLRSHYESLKFDKLLAYSGFLSSRSRSPEIVAGIISHAFDFERKNISIDIENFIFRKVEIPSFQRFRLGVVNNILSDDAIIGERVQDRAGKFLITLKNLDFITFKNFLPSRDGYKLLVELVEFILKDQFAYDLKLELKPGIAPPISLTEESVAQLGWSSFLGRNAAGIRKEVNLVVRS